MAKKQSSYSPNMGLIAGEAQVAASEAGLSNIGQSFAAGAASMFGAIRQANAERDARMEAYESEIGGLVNTNQFEDPKNKQVIKGFLNTQRDEFIKLSKIYDKTKDREVKDKMEEIKFSLVNLNDQIKVFNQDKLDYRTASDENQLASLKTYDRTGDDFFTTAFTNNATFSIDEKGDINFGINNNSYKYKDKAGKWQSKNNIDESNLLKIYENSYKEGGKGNAFNSGNVRRGLYNSFKNTGNSALQVFVTTDLTSDNSSLSFEEQFASGKLKEKHPEIYAGFTPTGKDKDGVDTYDTDWMFENKNGDLLRNKVSDYFTKVVEDGHGQGRADNYKPKTDNKESTLKNPERGGFLYGTNSTGFDDSHPDESKRSRVLNIGFDQMVRNRNALLPKNVTEGSEIQGEHYVYKFNIFNKYDTPWSGTRVCKYKNLKSIEYMRQKVLIKNIKKWWRPDKEKNIQVVNNGGWHFNNLFSPKEISIKLKTFAHQEFAIKKFSNESTIRKKISELKDLFDRNQKFEIVPLDNTYPKFIQKNKKIFKKFLAQH